VLDGRQTDVGHEVTASQGDKMKRFFAVALASVFAAASTAQETTRANGGSTTPPNPTNTTSGNATGIGGQSTTTDGTSTIRTGQQTTRFESVQRGNQTFFLVPADQLQQLSRTSTDSNRQTTIQPQGQIVTTIPGTNIDSNTQQGQQITTWNQQQPQQLPMTGQQQLQATPVYTGQGYTGGNIVYSNGVGQGGCGTQFYGGNGYSQGFGGYGNYNGGYGGGYGNYSSCGSCGNYESSCGRGGGGGKKCRGGKCR
jgi:hypothetical protein